MKLAYKLTHRGFSLIELIVVIAIMGIIAGISVFNHSKFTSDLAITNLAYEVALTIREAQVFGGSVKGTSGGDFSSAYGVYFDTAEPQKFISFVDSISPVNKMYDGNFAGCTNECLTIHALGRGNRIESVCRSINVNKTCTGQPESFVHITFLRPNLDARIKFAGNGPTSEGSEVYIILSAPDGTLRAVKVQSTGQIAVLN